MSILIYSLSISLTNAFYWVRGFFRKLRFFVDFFYLSFISLGLYNFVRVLCQTDLYILKKPISLGGVKVVGLQSLNISTLLQEPLL